MTCTTTRVGLVGHQTLDPILEQSTDQHGWQYYRAEQLERDLIATQALLADQVERAEAAEARLNDPSHLYPQAQRAYMTQRYAEMTQRAEAAEARSMYWREQAEQRATAWREIAQEAITTLEHLVARPRIQVPDPSHLDELARLRVLHAGTLHAAAVAWGTLHQVRNLLISLDLCEGLPEGEMIVLKVPRSIRRALRYAVASVKGQVQ